MSATTPILNSARTAMDRALDNTRKEFSGVRSGKASPSMLDTVRVEMYGQQMQLNQVASVSSPDPRSLLVTPFDKGQTKAIEIGRAHV